jgi:hypothetical protein
MAQSKSFNNTLTNQSLKTAEIIGIVTNITNNYKNSNYKNANYKNATTFFKLFFPNSKKTYNCQCDFFCPLRINDTIYGFCSIDDNENLRLIRLPFVQPAIDKDTLIQCLMKVLKIGFKDVIKLYTFMSSVADGNENICGFLSGIAQNWNDTHNIDILSMFDTLEVDTTKKLLKFWHKDRNLRRLYLLGLNKREIDSCKMSCDSIYQICVNNPYKLPQIPIEKCADILDMINIKPESSQIIRGSIMRVIWRNLNDNGWTGTPSKMLSKLFPDIKEHVQILKDEYGLVAEMETAYLKLPHKVETFITNFLVNMKNDDHINYDSPLDEPIEIPNDEVIIRRSAHFTRELSLDQQKAVQGGLDHTISIITGGAGTGKCLDPDTLILMYNGELQKIKNIKQNDLIMGPDSKTRKVKSVCDGDDFMYEIRPFKGKTFICNEPHVLTLKSLNKYITPLNNDGYYLVEYTILGILYTKQFINIEQAHNFFRQLEDDVFDIPLNEYLQLPNKIKKNLYLFHVGIEYPLKTLPLDAYIVGYFLGDNKSTQFIDRTHYTKIMEKAEYSSTNSFRLKYDEMIKSLSYLNIMKKKHIPNIYKINTFKNRVKLIAGFLASNSYQKYDDYIVIKLIEKHFIKDIEYIINSLGYIVECHNCNKCHNYSVEHYHLYVYGDKFEFIDNIKQDNPRLKNTYANIRFEVNPLGIGKYCGFELNDDGRFLLSNFMVTHNTTCLGELIHNLELRGIKYAVSSFTGKAVSRIREVSKNRNASTLHRLISNASKMKTDDEAFEHLIIDETSMVTTELLYNVLQVYPNIKKLTLVGDVNQLPPISWGDLFHQIIKSETIPTYRLTTNYRVYTATGERDGIILNANALITHDNVYPFDYVATSNFSVIEGGAESVYAIINGCYASGIKVEQLGIITPYNRTLESLNKKFQEIYNKEAKGIVDGFGIKWLIGDRVMLIENDPDIGVFNGENGIIKDVNDKSIMVDFGHGTYEYMLEEKQTYSKKFVDEDDEEYVSKERTVKKLTHSYAITIDKSQGSEWDFVIFYIPEFNKGSFLNKNRIYTALTRAKRCVWCVITDLECFNVVSVKNQAYRCDNLAKRLQSKLPNLKPFKIERPPILELEMNGDLPNIEGIPSEYMDNGFDCDDFE